MTTNGYKFYTLNLLTWLRDKAKVPWKLAVVCCDKESEGFFRREGWPCARFDMPPRKQQIGLSPFGSEEFKVWNRAKLDILHWIASHSNEFGIQQSLYLDGDIVVARDPWLGYSTKGLAFQCDCSHFDEHTSQTPCKSPCTGVIFVDHTESKEILEQLFTIDETKWKEAMEQDQPYVTQRLEQLHIRYSILSRSQYGNGNWQRSNRWKEDDWILLHYNYRVGDTKKQAMRKYSHWLIPY